MSVAQTGQSKPWLRGSHNPNYQNKAAGQPNVRQRFLVAVRARGQCWTKEQRQKHGQLMSGPRNAMRGRNHSAETLSRISNSRQDQLRQGLIKFRHYKLSSAEHEIAAYLTEQAYDFKQQFHIKGVPFLYDFFFPSLNLIIEYQGDYWHANPAKYKSGTLLRIPRAGYVLVDNIWQRDAVKREAALRHGYKFSCVWEHDYKSIGMEALRCLLV